MRKTNVEGMIPAERIQQTILMLLNALWPQKGAEIANAKHIHGRAWRSLWPQPTLPLARSLALTRDRGER